MVRKAFKPEQIINKLREAEVLLSQGSTVGEASRKLGVTEQTYYRWRKEYGGMRAETQDSQSCLPDSCRLREAGLPCAGPGQSHPASPSAGLR